MKAMGILTEQLRSPDLFTDTEQEVVNYILKHPEEVVHDYIGSLAKKTYSSNGTILRICRKTGCSGFREFKMELLKELESRKYVSEVVDFSKPFDRNDDILSIMNNMTSLYREGIDVIQKSLDADAIRKAARIIEDSRHVVVFASGDSLATAEAFINRLVKIGILAVNAMSHLEMRSISAIMDSSDCALIISYTGDNSNINPVLQNLRRNGVPVITVTAYHDSVIARYSTHVILIPEKEGTRADRLATYYSQFAMGYILNIMHAVLFAYHSRKNQN